MKFRIVPDYEDNRSQYRSFAVSSCQGQRAGHELTNAPRSDWRRPLETLEGFKDQAGAGPSQFVFAHLDRLQQAGAGLFWLSISCTGHFILPETETLACRSIRRRPGFVGAILGGASILPSLYVCPGFAVQV